MRNSKRRKWNSSGSSQESTESSQEPQVSAEDPVKPKYPVNPIKMSFVTEGELLLAEEGFTKDGAPVPALRRTVETPNDIAGAFIDTFNEMQQDEETDLTTWGKENQTMFYNLVARMAPKHVHSEHSGDVSIRHILPRNPLDE